MQRNRELSMQPSHDVAQDGTTLASCFPSLVLVMGLNFVYVNYDQGTFLYSVLKADCPFNSISFSATYLFYLFCDDIELTFSPSNSVFLRLYSTLC